MIRSVKEQPKIEALNRAGTMRTRKRLEVAKVSESRHFHGVQFYESELALAKTVASFLAEGFRAGEPAIVIATTLHAAVIRKSLNVLGFDYATLRQPGVLETFDATKMLSTFMISGMPDPLLFRSNVGNVIDGLGAKTRYCRVRAYGEMVDLLWQDGKQEAALRLEVLWNQLASTYQFSLLCGYGIGHYYKKTSDPRCDAVRYLHNAIVPTA